MNWSKARQSGTLTPTSGSAQRTGEYGNESRIITGFKTRTDSRPKFYICVIAN